MNRCPHCGTPFPGPQWQCPACRQTPPVVDGFLSFAPALAAGFASYAADAYADHDESAAERGFWSVSRSTLILWALARYFPSASSFLEVGCGAGVVLEQIERAHAGWRLVGCEALHAGLQRARTRLRAAELLQVDARVLPFDEEFDVAGAFDVLEHIDEDLEVLRSMFRSIKPGGGLMITVPQHRWLWSPADSYAGHVRRYTRRELVGALRAAGFQIERVTSFVTLLLPVMAASRVARRIARREYRVQDEMALPPLLDAAFGSVMTIERRAIAAGVPLPAGGSLLAVARKPIA